MCGCARACVHMYAGQRHCLAVPVPNPLPPDRHAPSTCPCPRPPSGLCPRSPARSLQNGDTVLHVAARKGRVAVLEELLLHMNSQIHNKAHQKAVEVGTFPAKMVLEPDYLAVLEAVEVCTSNLYI